ncbi:MAG: hypothetical protein J5776_05965, partial [Clostridiales bacterium]|nr:hypothetical protein [Clostridiales bacterium]
GYTDLKITIDDVSIDGYDRYEIPEYCHYDLSNEINAADSAKGVDYLQPMDGSGFKLAVKRFIRKFCKPVVAPLVESQNLFNGATARALAQIDAYITDQEGGNDGKRRADAKEFMDIQEKFTEDLDTRVILLEKKIEELEKKIAEMESEK